VLLVLALGTAFAIDGSTGWELTAYFVLFGAVFGAALPLRAVVMTEWYAGPTYGAIMGVQATVIAIARAVSPPAIGVLHDLSGSYGVSMTLLAIALAAAAALVFVSARTTRRK
jgi:MFS family permease